METEIKEIDTLAGYGYTEADQDGGQQEEVSAIEHKEQEFFEALRVILGAKPIEEKKSEKKSQKAVASNPLSCNIFSQ